MKRKFDDTLGGEVSPYGRAKVPAYPLYGAPEAVRETLSAFLASLHLGVGPDKRAHWDKCKRAPEAPVTPPTHSVPFEQSCIIL
jgi:hypothetical protein